jgi:hypothetical protein
VTVRRLPRRQLRREFVRARAVPAGEGLTTKTRAELERLAGELGIPNPDELPNRKALIDAIRKAGG